MTTPVRGDIPELLFRPINEGIRNGSALKRQLLFCLLPLKNPPHINPWFTDLLRKKTCRSIFQYNTINFWQFTNAVTSLNANRNKKMNRWTPSSLLYDPIYMCFLGWIFLKYDFSANKDMHVVWKRKYSHFKIMLRSIFQMYVLVNLISQ